MKIDNIKTAFSQSKNWRNKGLVTEWVALVFGLLLLLVFIGLWFLSEKQAVINRVNDNLVSQANRVAANLERQLLATHFAHLNIKIEVQEGLATQTNRTPFIYKRLNAFTQILPLVKNVKLADTQGKIKIASDNAATQLSSSEAELLQQLKKQKPNNLFFLINEITATDQFQLFFANQLTTPENKLHGLLITQFNTDHLAVLLDEAFIAKDTRALILNSQGIAIAAAEANSNLVGQNFYNFGNALKQHLESGAQVSLVKTNETTRKDERLIIHHNFQPNHPQINDDLIIVISRSLSDVLASLNKLTKKLITIYFFIALVSFIGLHFAQRKRKEAYDQIQLTQEELVATNKELADANSKLTRQSHQLELLAFQDGLTAIANRRSLDDNLDAAWQNCLKTQEPLAFIMLDIDFFKKYNDHYGHQQGDICLRQVAAVLAETFIWPKGKLARFGGEEFACLMPNASLEDALKQADELRLAVAALNLPHIESSVASHVTLSLGVAYLQPSANTSLAQLVRAADTALYKAKQSGRNQVAS